MNRYLGSIIAMILYNTYSIKKGYTKYTGKKSKKKKWISF